MELIIPALIAIVGAFSSVLISISKILIRKYGGDKQLKTAVARLITVIVCFAVTWTLLPVFEGSLAGFLTVFLGVLGSSQLTYYTGLDNFIETTSGTIQQRSKT